MPPELQQSDTLMSLFSEQWTVPIGSKNLQ